MQEETVQATAVPATAPDSTAPAKAAVSVRYEGNNSKRWDGKVVKLGHELLEGQELLVGNAVEMPWKGKGGKVTIWKGVIVSDKDETAPATKKRKSKLIYMFDAFSHLHIYYLQLKNNLRLLQKVANEDVVASHCKKWTKSFKLALVSKIQMLLAYL